MPILRYVPYLHSQVQALPMLRQLLVARFLLLHLPLPVETLITAVFQGLPQLLLLRFLWLPYLQVAIGNCSWLLVARSLLLHLPLPVETLITAVFQGLPQLSLQRFLWLPYLQVAIGNCSWLR
jgi:hypothetical protein